MATRYSQIFFYIEFWVQLYAFFIFRYEEVKNRRFLLWIPELIWKARTASAQKHIGIEKLLQYYAYYVYKSILLIGFQIAPLYYWNSNIAKCRKADI